MQIDGYQSSSWRWLAGLGSLTIVLAMLSPQPRPDISACLDICHMAAARPTLLAQRYCFAGAGEARLDSEICPPNAEFVSRRVNLLAGRSQAPAVETTSGPTRENELLSSVLQKLHPIFTQPD